MKNGVIKKAILIASVFGISLSCSGSMNGIYDLFGKHPFIFVTENGSGSQDGHDWENAYSSLQLQNAVDAATDGQEIWMSTGMYTVTIPVGKKLSLYGGFAGNERSRDERDPDKYKINLNVRVVSLAEEITIDGFYFEGNAPVWPINGGSVTFENCTFANISGQLVFDLKAMVNFKNCLFLNNSSDRALLCSDALVTFTSCTFTGNGSTLVLGGAIYVNGGTCFIQGHCTFTGNSAISGGAIYVATGSCTITDSTIENNTNVTNFGGGIYVATDATCTIVRSVVSNNKVLLSGGGIRCSTGNVIIRDSSISGNIAGTGGDGGGLSISNGNLSINGGSITGNTAGTGPQVHVNDSSGSIANCTIGSAVRNYTSISGGLDL